MFLTCCGYFLHTSMLNILNLSRYERVSYGFYFWQKKNTGKTCLANESDKEIFNLSVCSQQAPECSTMYQCTMWLLWLVCGIFISLKITRSMLIKSSLLHRSSCRGVHKKSVIKNVPSSQKRVFDPLHPFFKYKAQYF